MAGWTVVSGCDSWQTGGETIAQRRDGFQAHVARALHGPLIVLFEQQGTDESNNGRFVGEDADNVAASLDLAVEAFEWIGAVDLGTMLGGEAHIGKDIGFGVVHQCCQLGDAWPQLIRHLAPLFARCLGIVLRERGADPGGDDAPLCLAGIGHGIAHEVHAAFSPSWASETTSLTPRRPRLVRLRRNSVQNGSASLLPMVMPNTSRRPSVTI